MCPWTRRRSVLGLQTFCLVSRKNEKGYVMTTKTIQVVIVLLSTVGLIACGQGMSTKSLTAGSSLQGSGNQSQGGDDSSNGSYTPVPFDTQKVTLEIEQGSDEAVAQASAAGEEAERYLNKIKLGGGRIEIQGEEGASQQIIIDKVIKKVLDKIYAKLLKSPELFDALRAKIADKIGQLDSSNPLHQSAIAVLMVAMEKIDVVEARFKDVLGRLAGGIDIVISRLEVLVGAIPFPVSLLVAIEWADVKRVLLDFQSKVQNL